MLILNVCYGADGLCLGTGGWLWGSETCYKYLVNNFGVRRMGFGFGCCSGGKNSALNTRKTSCNEINVTRVITNYS